MSDTIAVTKKWWEAKGVIGPLVTVIALAAGFAGYQIAPEAQAEAIQVGTNALALIGAVVGLMGRLTATKRVAS